MKKFLGVFIFLISFNFVSALTCVDLQTNLSKGNENNSVKLLQIFLNEKGFLKSTPNGYFGPATVTALKAFQKSQGISQVGTTGPSTRSAIKKVSCVNNQTTNTQTQTETQNIPKTPVISTPATVVTTPAPHIDSIDKATFLTGGTMDAGLVIHGSNFSSTSNQIIFKIQNSNRLYIVSAKIASTATGTMITVPSTFTSALLVCGNGCKEKLMVGSYDVIVKTDGGESNAGFISIKSVNVGVTSGTSYSSIKQQTTGANLGTITLGSSVSLSLESLALSITGSPFDVSRISNIRLKDELTGTFVSGGGYNYDLAKTSLIENQSKIYGIYADINSPLSGAINISGVLKTRDFIGNNLIQVQIPTFFVTISG